MLKSKKGLSPILTTVMMIGIVVIGISITFAYFTDYVKNFQLGRGSSIMELIELEDVWFQDNQTIRINIYNYGKVETEIVTLYINNKLVDFHDENGLDNLIEIPLRGHGVIIINQSLTENTSYHLKLVTNRGSGFEGNYLSPSRW